MILAATNLKKRFMTILLQRLQPLIDDVSKIKTEGRLTLKFSKELAKTNFKELMQNHPTLHLEYNVLCAQIIHNLSATNREQNKTALIEQTITAFVIAELLTYIYRDYLNVPREVLRLQKEQEIFRASLEDCQFQFDDQPQRQDVKSSSFSQQVRDKTISYNWPRLIATRIRRLFLTSLPLAKNLPTYPQVVTLYEEFTRSLFSYLGWVFFVPRFTVSSYLLLKHLIPGSWMKEKEKSLGVKFRLTTQLERRWFVLSNDSVWLVAGLLGCFILTGALAPVMMYLTVGLFFYDVILAGIRALLEINRLKKLQIENINIIKDTMKNPEKIKEAEDYQNHLQHRIFFEQKRLLLPVINTSALFLGMCSALPILAACSPFIPFIGAILIVSITVAAYIAFKIIENQRPVDNISTIAPKGGSLFASSPHVLFPSAKTSKRKPEKLELNSNAAEEAYALANNPILDQDIELTTFSRKNQT
jgi:hypothetical protein